MFPKSSVKMIELNETNVTNYIAYFYYQRFFIIVQGSLVFFFQKIINISQISWDLVYSQIFFKLFYWKHNYQNTSRLPVKNYCIAYKDINSII